MRSAISAQSAPSVLAAPREPRLHVAIIAAFGVRDRQQKAFAAVEEAEAQHIGAEERPQAVPDSACERHARVGGEQHLGAGGRVAVDARYRLLEPRHRMVRELLLE